MLSEGRALMEFGAAGLMMPFLLQAPKGDGQAVMVIPGFLASDRSTGLLRTFLKMKGYKPEGWGLGRNLGTHIVGGKRVVSDQILDRVIEMQVKSGRKVSLVGWSLGGIFAREIARIIPDCVRQVISLGSPFNGPKGAAPVAAKLFEMINGDVAQREPEALLRMLQPPPVPSSAIFSRTDGVAHWESCKDDSAHDAIQAENIEVRGSHMGLGHNPQVLWIIANRLAQPEGQWSPFRQKAMHQLLYPNPNRV
jgi:pimeloyl-ACP methyl ester carboxylesterase